MKCKKCGFTWNPRIENPRACPDCKSYRYAEGRKQKFTPSKTVADAIQEPASDEKNFKL